VPGELDQSFRLKVLGDISDYQSKMSQIPGVTQKQAAAAALRMEREMVKAAANTGKAAQAAAKGGATELGKTFGQAKEQVALVAAGAARIDPELGAVVNTGSAVVGVLKSMVSPVGLFTAAVTTAAGVMVKFQGDIDTAEEKANESAKNAIKAQLGIVDSGYYVNQALEAQDKVSLEKRKGAWVGFARDYAEIFSLGGLNPIANAVLKKLDEYEAGVQANIKSLEGLRDRNIELAQSQMEVNEAKKKGKKDDVELDPKQQAEYAENQKKYDEAFLKRDEEIAKRKAKRAELDERRAKVQKDVDAAQQKMDDDAKAAAEVSRDAWLNAFGEINGAIGQMFGNSKASAIATAGVNIALGATKTIAELGFPAAIPALVGLAASGAAQLQQINKQSFSPTFHSGGIFGPSSPRGDGDVPFSGGTAQTGEGAILNRSTVARLGRRGVDELNRGGASGGRAVTASVFGHRVMDAWAVTSLSRWNSPTRAAITKLPVGVRPGHRER
jgi:hypothetical protein